MNICNQKGVTLTEIVVTFIIVGVLATGLLTVLGVNATETSEGVANSRLQMQYDNVMDQISRKAKNAKYILANDEDTGSITTYINDRNNVTHIRMYDSSGVPYAGYRINGAAFEELIDSANGTYAAFKAGKDAVALAPGSRFILYAGRKQLEARLNFKFTYKTVTDTLVGKPFIARCRN